MKVARINEKKITTYIVGGNSTHAENKPKKTAPLPQSNKVKGKLSKKARTRLVKAITHIVEIYSHRKKQAKKQGKKYEQEITFITLTLCATQKHTDYHIRRYMLIPFLSYLLKEEGVTVYVWRAEPQENGNIHFHILANKNICWRKIRSKWNSLQRKEGYIADYKAKFSSMNEDQYIRYRGGEEEQEVKDIKKAYKYGLASNWEDPNSSDIHQTGKLKNTIAYMAKYMGKSSTEQTREIEGHLWGKCEVIEEMKVLEVALDNKLISFIDKIKENKDNFFKEDLYFSFYWLKNADYNSYPKHIREAYIQTQEYNYSLIGS